MVAGSRSRHGSVRWVVGAGVLLLVVAPMSRTGLSGVRLRASRPSRHRGPSPDRAPRRHRDPAAKAFRGLAAKAFRGLAATVLPAGERLRYGLSLGPIHAGHAILTVDDTARLEGTEAYRVMLHVTGGALFFALDDSLVSWIAPAPLRTLRSDRRLHEGPSTEAMRLELGGRDGRYRLSPLPGSAPAETPQEKPSGAMPADPLDELAVLFLPRTLPLDPGADYRVPRYFDQEENPVELRVLDRETIRTPAGRFAVVALSAVIPGSGIFGRERHARVYVTDDADRTVVELTARTAVGKLRLYLTEAPPGAPGPGM